MEQTGTLSIRNVSKQYRVDNRVLPVLENITLTVPRGEFVSIVGASGCGKSTLLRLIVGLENDYQGAIVFNGEPITGASLERGIVFQDHRLFPWLSVEANIWLGLAMTTLTEVEKRKTIQEHLDLVGLQGFAKAYPYQLSGGMAQRAAIARALVNRPKILLLDEPLGSLDAFTRLHLQHELQRIWRQEDITMMLVTHDVDEAIYLADNVVILYAHSGRIRRIVPVPLAHPRDRTSPEFVKLKEAVLTELQHDIGS